MEHNYLIHSGKSKVDGAPIGSGRYRLGSGKRPFQGDSAEKVKRYKLVKEEEKENKKGWFDQTIKGGKDKPPVSPAEKVAKEASNAADSAKGVVDSIGKIKKINTKPQSRSKQMSDQELRNAINRLELERRYDSLSSTDQNRGFDTAREILGVVGGLAATAGSVATVYAVVKGLK